MSESESETELVIDNKHKRRRIHEELDEQALEKIVFGREEDVFLNISKKSKQKETKESLDQNDGESDSDLELDDSEDNEEIGEESDLSEDSVYDKIADQSKKDSDHNQVSTSETTKKSVWVDDDDYIDVSQGLKGIKTLPKKVTKQNKYKEYLENKFNDLYKTPKWAQNEAKSKRSKAEDQKSDSDESDDELMRTAQNFKIKSTKLDKGILAIKKCTHLTNDNKMKV